MALPSNITVTDLFEIVPVTSCLSCCVRNTYNFQTASAVKVHDINLHPTVELN